MEFFPISLDKRLNSEFETHPDCKEILQVSIDFFSKVGYELPWIGYYVKLNNEFVGSAAFKGKPKDNKVEIAYGTFKQYQGKGIGTKICRHLVMISLETDPGIIITARTLTEENASVSILKKNGFILSGTVWDQEDGYVWEWVYEGNVQNNQTILPKG